MSLPWRRSPAPSSLTDCSCVRVREGGEVQRIDQRVHAVALGDEPVQQLLGHEGKGQDALVCGVGLHAGDATRGRRRGQWTLDASGVGAGAERTGPRPTRRRVFGPFRRLVRKGYIQPAAEACRIHQSGGDMSAASFDALGTDRVLGSGAYRPEDFPGCESFHLPASEIDHYEGRLEFWDGVTETAWKVCEPTSIQHEEPSRLLGQMAGRFAMMRGSRIASFGSADLVRRDVAGRKRWLMQADEVLYLYPDRVRLQGPAIDVDADPLPDVVLEVDHTTDVRRRKLGIYMESGFPEIWVLVPWEASVRSPGLAIHVRRGAGYREEGESRAFPGWEAEEIYLRADRGADVGAGVAGAGTYGAGDGYARGHDAAARSAHGIGEREGAGKEPRPRSPGRPHGRCGRYPRIPGDQADPGHDEVTGSCAAQFRARSWWRRRWRVPTKLISGGGFASSSTCTRRFSGKAMRRSCSAIVPVSAHLRS